MPLTPADVHNVVFRKPAMGRRGYDGDEVDAFCEVVEAELARLIEENIELRASGGGGAPVEQEEPREDDSVRASRILAMATETADRYVNEAKAQSEQMLSSATTNSDRLMTDARRKSEQMVAEAQHRAGSMMGAGAHARGDDRARGPDPRCRPGAGRRAQSTSRRSASWRRSAAAWSANWRCCGPPGGSTAPGCAPTSSRTCAIWTADRPNPPRTCRTSARASRLSPDAAAGEGSP